MDSYYSSPPSYYYQPSCPFHNSYSPYPSSSQIIHYNNSTPNIYAQSSSPTQTTTLNTTFELGMNVLVSMTFIIFNFSSTSRSSPSSTNYILKRTSWCTRSSFWKKSISWYSTSWTTISKTRCTRSSHSSIFSINSYSF